MKAFLNYIVERIDVDAIIAFFEKVRKYFVKRKHVPRKFLTLYVFRSSYVCAGVSALLLNITWLYWFVRYFIYRADVYSFSTNASDAGSDYKLQFFLSFVEKKLVPHADQTILGIVTYQPSFYMPYPFGFLIILINGLLAYYVYKYFQHIHQLEDDQHFLVLLIFGFFGLFICWFYLGCLLTILDGILTHSFFDFTTDDYAHSELVFEPYFISSIIKFKVVKMYTIPDLYHYVFLRRAKECLEALTPVEVFAKFGSEIFERFKECFPYEVVMDQGKYNPVIAIEKRSFSEVQWGDTPPTLLEFSTPGWQLKSARDIKPYFDYYPEHGYYAAFDKFTADNALRAAEEAVSCFVTEDQDYNVMCRDHLTTPFQQTCRALVAKWIGMKYAWDYYQKAFFYRYGAKGVVMRVLCCIPHAIENEYEATRGRARSRNVHPFWLIKKWFDHDVKLWQFYYGERKRTWGRTPQGRKYDRYYYSSEWWGEKYMYEFYKNKKGKWVRGPQRPYKKPFEPYYRNTFREYTDNFYDWRHW